MLCIVGLSLLDGNNIQLQFFDFKTCVLEALNDVGYKAPSNSVGFDHDESSLIQLCFLSVKCLTTTVE